MFEAQPSFSASRQRRGAQGSPKGQGIWGALFLFLLLGTQKKKGVKHNHTTTAQLAVNALLSLLTLKKVTSSEAAKKCTLSLVPLTAGYPVLLNTGGSLKTRFAQTGGVFAYLKLLFRQCLWCSAACQWEGSFAVSLFSVMNHKKGEHQPVLPFSLQCKLYNLLSLLKQLLIGFL